MRFTLVLLIIILNFRFASISYAQRYALVIGNSEYDQKDELKNPVNDATDMGLLLKEKGFKVTVLKNADKRKMREGISKFTNQLNEKNSIGLFYYAGHGMQINGINYLIPVNVNINTEADVEFESIDVGRVLANMRLANNNLNMVILDACRNNPFKRGFRSINRGLASIDSRGMLIMYAASVGEVASDGYERNGLFTGHLMSSIKIPGLKVEEVFKRTAEKVYEDTKKKQFPWQAGNILGDFYFTEKEPKTKMQTIIQSNLDTDQAEIVFWESIQNETNSAFFSSYLNKYPKGIYAEIAKLKISNKSNNSVATTSRVINRVHLTIKTSPDDALVRILNIAPKYQDGLALKSGKYLIEVTKPYFKKKKEWVTLKNKDKTFRIVLQQLETENIKEIALVEYGETFILPEMILIKGGEFYMGSNFGDADEKPVHIILLKPFEIGRYEVTFTEFDIFAEETGYKKPNDMGWGRGSRPVINVSWNDALAYVTWLSNKTGKKYRLPKEKEWEYAAQMSNKAHFFFGNDYALLCQYANGADLSTDFTWRNHRCNDGYGKMTSPVGRFQPNLFGVYDMYGNAWEWVEDCWNKNYTERVLDSSKCASKVLRGGAWDSSPKSLRGSNRSKNIKTKRHHNFGFRLALSIN